MAFYKNDNDNLLFAPNTVYNKDYTLEPAQHATYTYPTDGWYWFNTENEAYVGLKLQPRKDPQEKPIYFTENPDVAS